jgi:hypothetical protein
MPTLALGGFLVGTLPLLSAASADADPLFDRLYARCMNGDTNA